MFRSVSGFPRRLKNRRIVLAVVGGMVVFVWYSVWQLTAESSSHFQVPASVTRIVSESSLPWDGNVLTPKFGYAGDPKKMMQNHLFRELADARDAWKRRYEFLDSAERAEEYVKERKEFFWRQLGKMWAKTPLNARIVKSFTKGKPGKDAYRVEMVLFESVPNFYVTTALFLPDPERFPAPYPAVLISCGHDGEAKGFLPYQQEAELAASNGLAALVVDPVGQGERWQCFDTHDDSLIGDKLAHYALGNSSILLGRNTATFEVWDLIRALDYLESRPDIDAKRIGATGNSGGGTQTAYIMSLDDRISAAAPICYLCGFYDHLLRKQGPQDSEQNIFGQLAFGMDHADYCIMRAPKPTLIGTTTYDIFPVEGAWDTCRYAKRIFDLYGVDEKMSISEHRDNHGLSKSLRAASVRWMLRWLAGRDELIVEPDSMPTCDPAELRCTEGGAVAFIDGSRSAFALNRDYNDELLAERTVKRTTRTDSELRASIRRITGVRSLDGIPRPEVVDKGQSTVPWEQDGISHAKRFIVKREGIVLPMLKFVPKTASKGITIYLNDAGKSTNLTRINDLAKWNQTVVAVDLRGLGETKGEGARYFNHDLFGTDGIDYYFAYLLGKSYVGMRTEDLLAVAQHFRELTGKPVRIAASGEVSGLVALHAAALEPSLFAGVELEGPLRSWFDVVQEGNSTYPLTNIVHGALLEYDLPELNRLIGRK